jgi:hypothetical protein
MNATNAYLVISQNPDNGMDCIDEFTSDIEACDFANEFGGVVVEACDYQPKGLLDGWFSGWLSEAEENYAG